MHRFFTRPLLCPPSPVGVGTATYGHRMSNTSGGPQLPPGYYQDAQGTMRWWDGSGWTQQTQQSAPPASSPYGQPSSTSYGPPATSGSASDPWFKKKRWWVVGAVGLLVIVAALGGGDTEEPAPTASDPAAADAAQSGGGSSAKKGADGSSKEPLEEPVEEPAEPQALKVPAGQMLDEFEGNEAAADIKYGDKLLEVTGQVAKVDTEFLDEEQYVVRLDGGAQFAILSVNCNDVTAEQAATIQVDSTVTVRGTFDDGGDLGVELTGCEVL